MEFKVSELEREPVEFDLELDPGAIDFGSEAEQRGSWGRPAARKSCTSIVPPTKSSPISASEGALRVRLRFPARAAWRWSASL